MAKKRKAPPKKVATKRVTPSSPKSAPKSVESTPRPRNIQKEILSLEEKIRLSKEKLAQLRREAPAKEVQDYPLQGAHGASKLSSLFGGKSELILIHNMGSSCSYCTLWADGFNGLLRHLESRVAFVVESPDGVEMQQKLIQHKGWRLKMVSSGGTSLKKDLGFEAPDGDPIPGVSVLRRDPNGKIFQVSSSRLGPGDNYCILWDLFDLLPSGKGDWEPQLRYS